MEWESGPVVFRVPFGMEKFYGGWSLPESAKRGGNVEGMRSVAGPEITVQSAAKWAEPGSNRRPSDFQSLALPTELSALLQGSGSVL